MADIRPEIANFRLERPNGGAGVPIDERKSGCKNKVLMCFTGLGLLWGWCPKSHGKKHIAYHLRKISAKLRSDSNVTQPHAKISERLHSTIDKL